MFPALRRGEIRAEKWATSARQGTLARMLVLAVAAVVVLVVVDLRDLLNRAR
jgi:hypothetical protein